MNLDLSKKVVVVTGSSKGIGRELIRAFSKENSKVVINYLNSYDEAEELYREITRYNTDCIKVKADVTNEMDVIMLRDRTISAFGKIDILINNAGVCCDNNIHIMPKEHWDRVINVNLTGVYLCCKTFSEIMMKQNMGKIINISSIKGQIGSAGQVNYSASKAGLIGLGKSLAKELSKFNISVNTVCPGYISTDLNGYDYKKKIVAQEQSLFPVNMNLQDLIHFILFVSSGQISSVTGQVFNIDSRI